MKKKNCTCEFSSHRNTLLIENFRKSIARQSQISLQKAFMDAKSTPAPRFWVSERRAAEVISKMLAGKDPTPSMYPEKREMYREIFRRVLPLRRRYPDAPLSELVFRVVNSEAPDFYLSLYSVRNIIYSLKKKKNNA